MKLKNQDTIELLGGRIDLPHKHVCRLYSQPNLTLLPSQMAISMPAPMVPPQSFVPVQALRAPSVARFVAVFGGCAASQ